MAGFYSPMPPGRPLNISAPRSMHAMWEGTMAFLTKTLHRYGRRVPNVDFTVVFGDLPPLLDESIRADEVESMMKRGFIPGANTVKAEPTAPIFCYANRDGSTAIATLTYDWNWITQDFSPNSVWRADKNPTTVFALKKSKAVWRGTPTSIVRVKVREVGLFHPTMVDGLLAGPPETPTHCTWVYSWGNKSDCQKMVGPFASWQEVLQNKYVIDVDGWGSTFRYKNLLLSNSVTLKVSDDLFQFFYRELIPFVHYIPIDPNIMEEDLVSKLFWLRKNDDEAMRISTTSSEYVKRHLREEDATWMQWATLMIYASRQNFAVTSPEDEVQTPPTDFREFKCQQCFYPYNRDVNCVNLSPTNKAGTGFAATHPAGAAAAAAAVTHSPPPIQA